MSPMASGTRDGSELRFRGRWLAEAGFAVGSRVECKLVSPGVIELRAVGEPRPDLLYDAAMARLDRAAVATSGFMAMRRAAQ